ncbi:MAG: DUF368 domain-containing protein [Bacilli bacterium]|nr:DUF368 domain-containing protein [Bacilli bacterium]
MENLILFLKGVIIGIGKIIPGLSGSMIMMVMGLYEKTIDSLYHFFDNIKGNAKFLITIGSGILLAIVLMSKLIKILLLNYYFIIICFFVGLILGGIPSIFNEVKGNYNKKNIMLFTFFLLLVTSLSFIDTNNQIILGNGLKGFVLLFTIGIIEAATMIIPGISGTAIMMILGLYNILLDLFSNLGNLNLIINNLKLIIPFIVGLIIGGIVFISLIKYLLTNHKVKTYFVIAALALSSVF